MNGLFIKLRNNIWEYCKINNIDSNIREDILRILRSDMNIK